MLHHSNGIQPKNYRKAGSCSALLSGNFLQTQISETKKKLTTSETSCGGRFRLSSSQSTLLQRQASQLSTKLNIIMQVSKPQYISSKHSILHYYNRSRKLWFKPMLNFQTGWVGGTMVLQLHKLLFTLNLFLMWSSHLQTINLHFFSHHSCDFIILYFLLSNGQTWLFSDTF